MKLSLLLFCSAAGTLVQEQSRPIRRSRRDTAKAKAVAAGTIHQKSKLLIEKRSADMDYSFFLESVYDCLKVRDVYDRLVTAIRDDNNDNPTYHYKYDDKQKPIPSGCQDNCQQTHIEAYVQSGCALFLSGCDIRPMTDLDVWIPQLLLVLDYQGKILKNALSLGNDLNWGIAAWEDEAGTTDKGKPEADRQIYCPSHTRNGIKYWEVDIYIGPGGILDKPELKFLNSRMIYGAREVKKRNKQLQGDALLMRYKTPETPETKQTISTPEFEMRMYTPSFCHMLELKMLLMDTGRTFVDKKTKETKTKAKTTDRDDVACVAPTIVNYFEMGFTEFIDNIGIDPETTVENNRCTPPVQDHSLNSPHKFLTHVPIREKKTVAGKGEYYMARNNRGDKERATIGTWKPASLVHKAWCHCKVRGAFELYRDTCEQVVREE